MISVKNFAAFTKSFVKMTGKKSILETRPNVLRGINPKLTYEPSGESFALPRYFTKDMLEARNMNKSSRICSYGKLRLDYSKASPENLRRLTSNTLQDSYSRCVYIRPEDGEIFNLLKVGETKDGKFIMRILDSEGAFIKEVQVKPKTHVLIDNLKENTFSKCNRDFKFDELYNLSHGEYMKLGARKANPFENVIVYDVSSPCKNGKVNPELRNLEIYRELEKRIKNGENIDIISQSRAATGIGYDLPMRLNGSDYNDLMSNISYKNLVTTANQKGIRVLNSAGNSGSNALNRNLLNSGAEGVGAVSGGKIAEYSASRNTIWTQHYEESSFPIVFSKDGINITGTSGVDLVVKNPLIGQNVNAVHEGMKKLYTQRKTIMSKLDETTDPAIFEKLKNNFKLVNDDLRQINNWLSQLCLNKEQVLEIPAASFGITGGTSLATATRAAKINLNQTMKEIL